MTSVLQFTDVNIHPVMCALQPPWEAWLTGIIIFILQIGHWNPDELSDLPNSWSWLVEDPELEPRTSPKALLHHAGSSLRQVLWVSLSLAKFRGSSPAFLPLERNTVLSICLNARESKEPNIFYFFILIDNKCCPSLSQHKLLWNCPNGHDRIKVYKCG